MRTVFFLPLILGSLLVRSDAAWGGQKTPPSAQKRDPALVTARLKSMPLRKALKELSRLTGTPLEAAPDTADLRVTMFVRDLPLQGVKARIAEAFFLSWKSAPVAKGRPAVAVLYRSARDAATEQQLRARGETAFRKGIDEAIGVLPLSASERERLFARRQDLANTFGRSGSEAAVALLSYLTPNQRTDIMNGHRLEFFADRPPSELAPHLNEIRKALHHPASAQPFKPAEEQCVIERIGEGAESRLQVTWNVRTGGGGFTGLSFPVQGTHSTEAYPEAYARDHVKTGDVGASQSFYLIAPLTAASLDDLLEKVADNFHINLIGESYWEPAVQNLRHETVYPRSVREGNTTIDFALTSAFMQNYWWKQANVYLFQRPLWWVARRNDVTDAAQAQLKQILRRQPLSLEDGGEVCKILNYEQMEWLKPRYSGDYQHLQPIWALMRFYGCLKPAQQAQLFQEGGIEDISLSAADRQRLHAWIDEKRRNGLPGTQQTIGPVCIRAVRLSPNMRNKLLQFQVVRRAEHGATTLLLEEYIAGPRLGD